MISFYPFSHIFFNLWLSAFFSFAFIAQNWFFKTSLCSSSKELSKFFLKQTLFVIIIRCFFLLYNIFFYTQQAFVYHPLVDFCIIHNHIAAFFFFSFSSLERLWYLSQAFFEVFRFYFDDIYLTRSFYICEKKFT